MAFALSTDRTGASGRTLALALGALLFAWALIDWLFHAGTTAHFELVGVPVANRTINQLTAVVLTCMALIVPLTSNLYTPKLVKLYVTHPLIVCGLTVLIVSNLLAMVSAFFPPGHALARPFAAAVAFSYLLVMAATLPFLYAISRFLRPGYFLRMLARNGIRQLQRINRGGAPVDAGKRFFNTVDVLTNIALTGMTRGDRQLVLLALHALDTLLQAIIRHHGGERDRWRSGPPFFVPGLAREGQQFLRREGIWPEAYLLGQMLKVMEVASRRQHEVLAEIASQLIGTAQLAGALQRGHVVELHVMAFNTLLREAIDERDLRRFQNVSYHYRILIESFVGQPGRMQRDAYHLVHYANLAARQGLEFGFETVIYDVGELVLATARRDQQQAIGLLEQAAGSLLRSSLGAGGGKARIGWRTLIWLYWQACADGLDALSQTLRAEYLRDDAAHREQIARALGENRELHFEFNDRLMRFAHLSPQAEALAREFARAP